MLNEWAAKWRISPAALADLRDMYAKACEGEASGRGEAYVQSAIRLEAPKYGVLLMRNNVGALLNPAGVPVRFGLMNDNAALNKRIKSSDLIGISSKLITLSDVGKPRGQLVARENKTGDWKWTGTPREVAQQEFHNLINAWGGDAKFARGPGTFV